QPAGRRPALGATRAAPRRDGRRPHRRPGQPGADPGRAPCGGAAAEPGYPCRAPAPLDDPRRRRRGDPAGALEERSPLACAHPGMIGARIGAPAPSGAKFDFWRSMADLAQLVMRSGASFLRLRIAAALALVFVGKFAGVWAPVVLGDAVSGLKAGEIGEALPAAFMLGAVAYAGLMLVAAWVPFVRDAIFTRVSQATMAKAAIETFQHALSLGLDFHQSKQMGALSRIIDRGSRSTDFLIRSVVFSIGPPFVELVMAMAVFATRLGWRFSLTTFVTILVYAVVTFRITDWRLAHRREWAEADSRIAGLSVDA